jgi:hypothetical protein
VGKNNFFSKSGYFLKKIDIAFKSSGLSFKADGKSFEIPIQKAASPFHHKPFSRFLISRNFSTCSRMKKISACRTI